MKNEDDFIGEIEDTLHAYEDAYVPGAWEAFQQKRKRRRMALLFFRVSSAAAILALFSYVAAQFFTNAPIPVQVSQTKNIQRQSVPKPSQPGHENIIADTHIAQSKISNVPTYHDPARPAQALAGHDVARPIQTLTKQDTVRPMQNLARYAPGNKQPALKYSSGLPLTADDKSGKPNDIFKPNQQLVAAKDTARANKSATSAIQNGVIANNPTEKYRQDNKPVYDILVKNKTKQQPVSPIKTKTKSLSYAVIVSPALGNQKVNFGTGVQVSYHINNNLSVSSGIAYAALNGSATGNPGTDASKKVQGVNLDVSGFEVPLGLQYKTNGGFYVSAGVVGMSVMNDHLNYNYLTQSTITAAAVNSAGLTQQVVRVVSEQKTEESKEKINNYMGFYILSVGKKKAVGRNQINFGPFLRVPFGAVTSEKVNLMQGGIHLGFEF